ncbi:hypothetical protein CDAR_482211 [Caerostris darwini]|uniref:Secreted protein n=1 Tax=Caerostris darwini TaxID=1538125 RepID=A0AAV4TJG5_9ARAC|nr:hypothetical protein CDAR_482211 [Caerostris darwini]
MARFCGFLWVLSHSFMSAQKERRGCILDKQSDDSEEINGWQMRSAFATSAVPFYVAAVVSLVKQQGGFPFPLLFLEVRGTNPS